MLRNIAGSILTGSRHMRVRSNVSRISLLRCAIHTGASKSFFPVTDKDLPSPSQLTPVEKLYSQDTDILLDQIRRSRSIDRILELVSMHIDVMNNKHICMSFEIIHETLRENLELVHTSKLQYDENFQLLCNRAMSRARYLEPEEIITVYKTLSVLKVPNNTYVMQAMLKMLCSQINELSLNQLTFLNFLLSKQRRNALVDSLILALPLVLQVQIDQQLDSDNLNEVVSCLKMACKARLKPTSIEKVIAVLQNKIPVFRPEHAASIIFALFSMETPADGYMQLLKASFNIVTDNIEVLPRKSIAELIRLCRKQGFYYRSFFAKVCCRVEQEQWQFNECFDLQDNLNKLGYFSPEVLEILSHRMCNELHTVNLDRRYSILTLTEFFTYADCEMPNLQTVLTLLSSLEDKIMFLLQTTPYLFFKLVSSWAMLRHFPPKYLEIVLNEDFLLSAWSAARRNGRADEFLQYMCSLQWALEVYNGNENWNLPQNVMKRVNEFIQQQQLKEDAFPLFPFLANGLGGTQFFLTGMYTNNGHFVDHVLAMRNGNYPVALSNASASPLHTQKVSYIEDIVIPEDAKIISVVVGSKHHFCTDPEILKGHVALKLKSLSKMSYSPVIVNYERWVTMPDRERIPYLMQEIKQAASLNANSVAESNF